MYIYIYLLFMWIRTILIILNSTKVRLMFDVWRLISNINHIQFHLMFDIKHQPDTVLVDVWRKMFFHTSKNEEVQSKNVKIIYLFWKLHILNIGCQLAVTRLMIAIKYQPDRVLVGFWYQTSTRTASRYMFSLHFRVCRSKRCTILTPFWLHFVVFSCMKKTFFFKRQL